MADSRPKRRQLKQFFGQKLKAVSGRWAASWLFACLLVSAVLIPFAIRRDAWIRAELVLLCWWVIWTLALAYLLHRRLAVTDDHRMGAVRTWGAENLAGDVPDAISNVGCLLPIEGEGCLVLLGVVAAVAAVWFAIELAIPALTFVLYVIIRGMLARVANDRHACEGSWPRSIAWGGIWAAAYTAPLALLVWGLHILAVRPVVH